MEHKSKTKRSIGPAGASIVSDDGTRMKLSEKDRKLVEKAMERMKGDAGTFLATITEVVGKQGKGPAGQRVKEMKKNKKSPMKNIGMQGRIAKAKGGGLMEATARLKAKGMKEGGMVVKDKTIAIDKSPNSGLITVKGFGASRRT